MGTVTNLRGRKRQGGDNPPGRAVRCQHCGEKHPLIRLADGEVRCVTAFTDGQHWFCRNRGCRAAWLARQSGPRR